MSLGQRDALRMLCRSKALPDDVRQATGNDGWPVQGEMQLHGRDARKHRGDALRALRVSASR